MTARDEEAAVTRAVLLSEARRLASAWGYWCTYAQWGELAGRKPRLKCGGLERRYKCPPQWNPPEPKMPEADENAGMAVQRAMVAVDRRGIFLLPGIYRKILQAEYCYRPWYIGLKEGEVEVAAARKARVSVGAYDVTLSRALLALANVMKRKGLWLYE